MSRHLRLKRNAQSLVISLSLHAGLLALLYWMVTSTVVYQKLVLTVASVPQRDHQPLVSLVPPAPIDLHDADADKPIPIDVLNSANSLASVNAKDFRSSLAANLGAVEFFGSHAYGNRFVFVLDISTSMSARNGDRFERAKAELLRSVSKLTPQQSYYVLLFSWQTIYMYGYPNRYAYKNRRTAAEEDPLEYIPATAENLDQLRFWLSRVRLLGGTDPRRALSVAHSMQPDAIFLLSDGQFNRTAERPGEGWINKQDIPDSATVAAGVKIALLGVPVHTIAYENPLTRNAMREIAQITGGSRFS